MAIEYSKVGWAETPYKYANPTNMDKMDTGIKNAVDGVNALEYVPSALEEIKVLGWSTPTAMSVRNYVDSSRTLHVRVGRVDLGTLNWVQYGGHYYNYGGISYKTTANSVPFNGYTSKYTTVSFDYLNAQSGDKCVGATNDGYLCIRDTSYSDATALRNAVSGTYLYYELATEYVIPLDGSEVVNDQECLKYLGWTVPKQLAVKNVAKNGGGLIQRVGRVDLGSLNWLAGAVNDTHPYKYFYVNHNTTNIKPSTLNLLCNAYETSSPSYLVDKRMWSNQNALVIVDSSFTYVADFKKSVQGEYLYYEMVKEVTFSDGSEKYRNVDELKFLGWTTPREYVGIPNYVDASGVFHQRVGRVDLGTLSWNYYADGENRWFYSSGINTSVNKPSTNSIAANVKCSKYTTKAWFISDNANDVYHTHSGVAIDMNGDVIIADTSFTDATQFRNAVSGQYLYYELGASVEIAEGNEIGILRYADVTISASSVSAYSDVRATVTVPSGYTAISVVSLTNNNAEFVPYLRKVSDTSYAVIIRNTTASTLSYQANTYRVVMARL